MAKRTRIPRVRLVGEGFVILRARNDDGEMAERTFWVPAESGYIVEQFDGGDVRQVCEGLSRTGNTLSATPQTLLAVIRREDLGAYVRPSSREQNDRRLQRCKTLDDLHAMLNEIDAKMERKYGDGHRSEDNYDSTSLPLFGGPEPNYAEPYYSYDVTHILKQGDNGWYQEARDPDEEADMAEAH